MSQRTTCKIFLISLTILALSSFSAAQQTESVEVQARRLLNALGCKGCHQFEGDGGSLAPPLYRDDKPKPKAEILDYLPSHVASRGTGFIPNYASIPVEDLKILNEFLYRREQP